YSDQLRGIGLPTEVRIVPTGNQPYRAGHGARMNSTCGVFMDEEQDEVPLVVPLVGILVEICVVPEDNDVRQLFVHSPLSEVQCCAMLDVRVLEVETIEHVIVGCDRLRNCIEHRIELPACIGVDRVRQRRDQEVDEG